MYPKQLLLLMLLMLLITRKYGYAVSGKVIKGIDIVNKDYECSNQTHGITSKCDC